MAWDDDRIDDRAAQPAETWKRPRRTTHRSAEMAEDAAELSRREGHTREHAAARLGVSRPALDRAISRAQRATDGPHQAQRARFTQAAVKAGRAAPGYEAEAG